MRTPAIFEGQPRVISLLILALYFLFGPYMQDEGDEVSRPHFPWSSLTKFILAAIFLAIVFYFILWIYIKNIWILVPVAIILSFIAVIASMPSDVSYVFITIDQRRAPTSQGTIYLAAAF